MRTSETLLLDFIRQSPQFRIPVNQRRFGWTQRECRQLWEDGSVCTTSAGPRQSRTVDAEPPARLVMAQTLVDNRQSNRRIELHAVHPPPLVATDKGP